ncbi:MAG TPA: DUF790 family protein [Polyangiaceae bacterium]|nr:DUF790 family protein [Polyangiaceae bacterium]
MLPQALLVASVHLEGERIVPHYLTGRDEAWLRLLLDEYRRFVGRKCSELREHLRQPLAIRAPKAKLRVATLVLEGLCRARPVAVVPPKEARASLFRAAAKSRSARDAVMREVAASFAVSVSEIEHSLFADLQSEWRVSEPPLEISPSRLIDDANLAIVGSLVRRAIHVRILVWGNARALLRQARFVGLICTLARAESVVDPGGSRSAVRSLAAELNDSNGLALDISGPLALFRHTAVYGRALASLLPRLAYCDDFQLTATCSLAPRGQPSSFVLSSKEAIATRRELGNDQRRVEARLLRDWASLAPDWELVREPDPLWFGDRLIFPEFELVHRREPSRRWLLEIVGFWTHDFLHERLRALRAAGIERLLLCIDQNRPCTEGEPPLDARIIRYKTRIDPRAVLGIIDPGAFPNTCK